VLAHQTYCEIWAQGPVSLGAREGCRVGWNWLFGVRHPKQRESRWHLASPPSFYLRRIGAGVIALAEDKGCETTDFCGSELDIMPVIRS